MAASGGKAKDGTRMSALWGSGGKRGDGARSSALWGKGGRAPGVGIAIVAVLAMALPLGAAAGKDTTPTTPSFYIPAALLGQAQAAPADTFNLIVQGDGSKSAGKVARRVAELAAQANNQLADAAKKADDTLKHAQDDAAALAPKAAQAKADAAAKATKALLSGKQSDRDAAAKASLAAADAQQAADAAQAAVAQAQTADDAANAAVSGLADKILKQQIKDQFSSINGVSATLTGKQIGQIVDKGSDGLLSITPNAPVQVSGGPKWSSSQLWPFASKSANNWKDDGEASVAANMPTIAIVDSGIQNRSDFGSRIVASVNLSTLPNNSPGDGRGHGTFVAGIAAGGNPDVTGANPAANLVDIDVMDDNGMGLTGDIIRACQWILDNKDKYNIRVANFSLHSTITAPFYIDPLDRAVEQLWFNGIVVVAAAGNYGSGTGPTGVVYSPGDDPFVITVGAADLNKSSDPKKATIAPWSAWGSTIDGFGKPELSAPGRYMIGPVPTTSTLVAERPDNVTSPGYIQLSGTSFAAPVVSGAAANILAQHPGFTPDQVKGALMVTAKGTNAYASSGGVGIVQAKEAADKNNPPNPNVGLDAFVRSSSLLGGTSYSFDSASWNSAARASASWNSVSWNSASWNSASWNSASWNSASWNSVSWNSASWNSASWNSASWNSASWNSASWNTAAHEDGVEGDSTRDSTAFVISAADLAALLADPTLASTVTAPAAAIAAPTVTTAVSTVTTAVSTLTTALSTVTR